jgi:tryptophan halogenase
MLGQGIVPEEYEPAADALDEGKVAEALEQMRLAILDVAERMPTHAEFIARTCAAQGAAPRPPLPEFVF